MCQRMPRPLTARVLFCPESNLHILWLHKQIRQITFLPPCSSASMPVCVPACVPASLLAPRLCSAPPHHRTLGTAAWNTKSVIGSGDSLMIAAVMTVHCGEDAGSLAKWNTTFSPLPSNAVRGGKDGDADGKETRGWAERGEGGNEQGEPRAHRSA